MKQWDIVYYLDGIKIKKVKIKTLWEKSSIVSTFIIDDNNFRGNFSFFSIRNENLFIDLNKAKKRALDNLDQQISYYLTEMEEKRKEILFKFI